MADNDPVVFDERSAKLIEAAVKRVKQTVRNPGGRPAESYRISSGKWLPFINESSEDVPPYACMRVTGSTYDDDGGITILRCDKPSTVFATEYVFNSNRTVPANSSADATDAQGGLCTYGPWAVVASDTTITLANGDKLGPKPGTWQVFRGWPTVARVAGAQDATERWAFARVGPITSVVAKTSSAISAVTTNGAPGTGTAVIWTLNGSTFAESSPRQSFSGTNFSTVASTTTDLYGFTERDGAMCMDAPASPPAAGGGIRFFTALLTSALVSGASTASIDTVTSLSTATAPTPTSATNNLALAGDAGDLVLLLEDTSSGTTTYTYRIIQIKHHTCST